MNPLHRSSTLPEPDADARAHGGRVVAFIRAQIEAQNGWISLHDYIQHALYAPGLGYYMAGAQRFGGSGDFVTAPELTPLYAQTWAAPIAEALARHSSASFLELGAGNGAFAAAVLPALYERNVSPRRYFILEKSPVLRERQRETLEACAPGFLQRVAWLETLPETFAGCVFMNEVLDALPPRTVLRRGGNWFEQGVVLDGDRFAFAPRPLAIDAQDGLLQARALALLPPNDRDDAVVEINLAAEALTRTLAQMLVSGGTLFISDYGFERGPHVPAPYRQGTLRGYYRHHRVDDPFFRPGLTDLTTHIDFVAIVEAAQQGGLALGRFQTQGEFLLEHGILDRLSAVADRNVAARGANAPVYPAAAQAVHTLIAPEDMGEIFKVLTLSGTADAGGS